MTQPTPTVNPWSDDDNSVFLRLRMKTFWNFDYFERIILLFLDLHDSGVTEEVHAGGRELVMREWVEEGSGGGRSGDGTSLLQRCSCV